MERLRIKKPRFAIAGAFLRVPWRAGVSAGTGEQLVPILIGDGDRTPAPTSGLSKESVTPLRSPGAHSGAFACLDGVADEGVR
jgi:hypothetical protein